ncbi:MAG: hypothetical protein ACRCZF_03450, partial [Gemmataceae bacterium]
PVCLFWGVIDRRLDLNYLKKLSARMDRGSIVLIGPQEDPHPDLFTIPRVQCRPARPFAELPALARSAAVLIMPYADLPVTRAMQPLKLKEYLATGRPVVVSTLPTTTPWADACDVAATPDEFAEMVLNRFQLAEPPAEQWSARERLSAESWSQKAQQLQEWISGPPTLLPPRRS